MNAADKDNRVAYIRRVNYTASQVYIGFEAVRGVAKSTAEDIYDSIGEEARKAGLTPRQRRLAQVRLNRMHENINPLIIKTQNYVARVVQNEYNIAFYEHTFSTQFRGFKGSLGSPTKEQAIERFETFPSVYIDKAGFQKNQRDRINRDIDRAILSGLNEGKSLRDTSRAIDVRLGFRTTSGELTDMGKRMLQAGKKATPKGEIYATVRVARTEMSRMNGWADVDAMRRAQLKGFDERLQMIATLDDRTRPQSAKMNGQVSNADGKFKYPNGQYYYKGQAPGKWSINDRETTVPYIDPAKLEKYADQTLPDGEQLSAEFRTWDEFQKAEIPGGINRYGQAIRI